MPNVAQQHVSLGEHLLGVVAVRFPDTFAKQATLIVATDAGEGR
jgi:hypothetical protein